jgi:hypothetical protein
VSGGNAANEKQWQDELNFFHDEQFATDTPFTELIKSYRDAKEHPKVARSLLGAIIMPTNASIGKLKNRGYTEFEHLEAHVAEAHAPYEVLFNKPNEFHIRYPKMGPDEILDVMESFDRIQPLCVKCCPVVYLCLYRHCYQNYMCIESAVLSLLYNTELEVPDIARLKQIKERERTELANLFNA